MTSDQYPALGEMMPLPPGIKLRRRKFGADSPIITVNLGGNASDSERLSLFELHWNDPELGLTVMVREQPSGRLVTDVACADAGLLNKWVSVALMGTFNTEMVRKTIPLDTPEGAGCGGFADFGPLADAVKLLGPQLRIVVILMF